VTTRKRAPIKKKSKPSPKAHSASRGKKRPTGKPARKPAGKPAPKSKPRLHRPPAELPTEPRFDEKARKDSLVNAKAAIAAALDKKAVEPVLIDVCGRSSYADFIAVVSGRSDRQVDAIAEGVCEAMAALGRRPLGREGARNGRWVLIDFGDVVMHVFYHPLREVFDIESLWVDAPRVKLQIPAEAKIDAPAPPDDPELA
jgi:ribosome-associated protein